MCVGEFYEMLDSLPEACDDFDVRFTTHDRSTWMAAVSYCVDSDGDLCLQSAYDDEDNECGYTVDDLKELLSGERNDGYDDVKNSMDVYAEYRNYDDSEYHLVLSRRFWINWKRRRVDVFIKD